MTDDTLKPTRGRPRVDEATKRAKAVARATAYRERRKADRVEHMIYISREVETYLDEIMDDERKPMKPPPTISGVIEQLIDNEHLARFGKIERERRKERKE